MEICQIALLSVSCSFGKNTNNFFILKKSPAIFYRKSSGVNGRFFRFCYPDSESLINFADEIA